MFTSSAEHEKNLKCKANKNAHMKKSIVHSRSQSETNNEKNKKNIQHDSK